MAKQLTPHNQHRISGGFGIEETVPNQRNGRLTRQQNPRLLRTLLNRHRAGRMRGERGAQDRTAGGTHRLPHAYSARVQRSERGRAAAGEGRRNCQVSAETCPHYLTLDCDHIPDNATAVKCCPPIRDLHEQDALWAGLARRHVGWCRHRSFPASADMKAGTLATAWGGVSSLQVGFRAVLTGAMRRGLSLADVVRWMSCNTARLVGLDDRGDITPVLRADLAIIRPYERFVVDATALESRNPICACDGMTLNGVVTRTFVAGGTRSPECGRGILSFVRESESVNNHSTKIPNPPTARMSFDVGRLGTGRESGLSPGRRPGFWANLSAQPGCRSSR